MGSIRVSNVRDEQEVKAALQQAVDSVLNQKVLARMSGQTRGDYLYQYVHPSSGAPAIGGASLLVGGVGQERDSTSLFVTLYTPGRHGGRGVYVPSDIINALGVQLQGLSHVYHLEFSRLNSEAVAHMKLPTATFLCHPRALIIDR